GVIRAGRGVPSTQGDLTFIALLYQHTPQQKLLLWCIMLGRCENSHDSLWSINAGQPGDLIKITIKAGNTRSKLVPRATRYSRGRRTGRRAFSRTRRAKTPMASFSTASQ